jgi:ribosomal-protein-alanine N-acetyltransferase
VIPLPDPPLRSGDLLLRPWRVEDAPALSAAWADPDVARWTGVPVRRDLPTAERWIRGDEDRRRRWISLDLVVDLEGRVAGEVGLSSFDRSSSTVEIGWWTGPEHRRLGVASTAARLVADWASAALGMSVVARCDPANPGSVAVAERAGAIVLL